ncbi:MAG: hypothetical protein KDD61_12415 [Bdellovibrionales bacterium]|nr:hypothetical protein [Bdellovibrionales bacterium]
MNPGKPQESLWVKLLKIVLFPILIMANPKIYFKDVQDLPDRQEPQNEAHSKEKV